MAEGKIKYGGKKFKKMFNELCKEAVELSIDYKCKVGIFLAPKKIDENSTMYAFGSPFVASVVEEFTAKVKTKKRKKLVRKTKKKAKLQMREGNCAEPNVPPAYGCELGVVRVVEDAHDTSEGR